MRPTIPPVPAILMLISAVLAAWGAAGLAEYAAPGLGLGLQNPAFPPGLQFLHFFAILLAGAAFLIGYPARWRATPHATTTMYAVLATLCFIETVDFDAFGVGPTRYIPMAAEYAAYAAISAWLFRAPAMRRRFGAGAGSGAGSAGGESAGG